MVVIVNTVVIPEKKTISVLSYERKQLKYLLLIFQALKVKRLLKNNTCGVESY